jgi:phosphoadenylyl-sulfate reductase (thioredoxin)
MNLETTERDDVEQLRFRVKVRTAEEVLAMAVDRFQEKVTMATGFGVEGLVLIDLLDRLSLSLPIFTLDTGLFFPETYRLWENVERRYGIRIEAVRPGLDLEAQAARFGDALWATSPDACCKIRKVDPLARELGRFDAWITAIRREQTESRSRASWVEWDARFGLVKLNPLLEWGSEDVWRYAREREVPVNPMHQRGYPSIGCVPCTTPVEAGEDARAGRWRGRENKECGLHDRPGGAR